MLGGVILERVIYTPSSTRDQAFQSNMQNGFRLMSHFARPILDVHMILTLYEIKIELNWIELMYSYLVRQIMDNLGKS